MRSNLSVGSLIWYALLLATADAGSPSGLAAVATLLLGYLAMYALDQVAHRWQSSRHPQQPHQQQYHTCPGEDTPCRQTSCPTTPKGAAAAAVRGPRDHSPSFSGWGRSPASLPGVSHSPGASISPSRRDPEHASSTTSRGSSPRHSAARDRPGHVVVISGPRPQQLDYTDKQQQQQQSVAVGSRERPEQQQESGGAMDRTWSDDGKPRQGKAAGPSAAQAILPGLCIHAGEVGRYHSSTPAWSHHGILVVDSRLQGWYCSAAGGTGEPIFGKCHCGCVCRHTLAYVPSCNNSTVQRVRRHSLADAVSVAVSASVPASGHCLCGAATPADHPMQPRTASQWAVPRCRRRRLSAWPWRWPWWSIRALWLWVWASPYRAPAGPGALHKKVRQQLYFMLLLS
jgi:hypothetical protein